MATYNDAPAEKDDIFKILAKLPPKEVEDPEAPDDLQARIVRRDADVRDVTAAGRGTRAAPFRAPGHWTP